MEMENDLENINQISNRQYILSPTVENGEDRECTNKDFYQESNEPLYLGRMGYGIKVLHRKTNNPYIIINFEKGKIVKPSIQQKINSSLELMYNAASNYLIRLLNHYENESNLFLIIEPLTPEILEDKIQANAFDFNTIMKIFLDVCCGVKKLHQFNMFNISLVPDTIIIEENNNAKLTDYGLKMSTKPTDKKPVRFTKFLKIGNVQHCINSYTTPEELEGIRNKKKAVVSEKTDSWKLGILLYELVTNFQSPFKGNSIDELAESILNCEIDLSVVDNELALNIISKLIKKEPSERAGIDDILAMEEFADYKNMDDNEINNDICIINPPEEDEEKEEDEDDENNNNNSNSNNIVMQSLKFENANLRQKIKQLENKMHANDGDEHKAINEGDEDGGSNSENEGNDEDEYENDDDENIASMSKEERIKYLKEKFTNLKKKYTSLKDDYTNTINKTTQYENDIVKLNKDKKELEEKIEIGAFEKIAYLSTSQMKNLIELDEKLSNAIDIFQLSQNSFTQIINNLLNSSDEIHEQLLTSDEEHLGDKQQQIINSLEEIKSNLLKPLPENLLVKKYTDKLKEIENKIEELNKFKSEHEIKVIDNEKIEEEVNKLKEENQKINEEISKVDEKNKQLLELTQKTEKEIDELEMKKRESISFIQARCDNTVVKSFQKITGLNWDNTIQNE